MFVYGVTVCQKSIQGKAETVKVEQKEKHK